MIDLSGVFKGDVESNNFNVVPLILLSKSNAEDIWISTTPLNVSALSVKPLLLNFPTIRESIDFETRKYKISSLRLQLSNYEFEGERLSDLHDFNSREVGVFFGTQSASSIIHFLPVYNGKVKSVKVGKKHLDLNVEDKSQELLHKDLPSISLEDGLQIPEESRNKPIPMVYGHVEKSPLVFNDYYTTLVADSKDVNEFVRESTVFGIDRYPLHVLSNGHLLSVADIRDNDSVQYEIKSNKIEFKNLDLPTIDNEGTVIQSDETVFECLDSTKNYKITLSNTLEDATEMTSDFDPLGQIRGVSDGSYDDNEIDWTSVRTRDYNIDGPIQSITPYTNVILLYDSDDGNLAIDFRVANIVVYTHNNMPFTVTREDLLLKLGLDFIPRHDFKNIGITYNDNGSVDDEGKPIHLIGLAINGTNLSEILPHNYVGDPTHGYVIHTNSSSTDSLDGDSITGVSKESGYGDYSDLFELILAQNTTFEKIYHLFNFQTTAWSNDSPDNWDIIGINPDADIQVAMDSSFDGLVTTSTLHLTGNLSEIDLLRRVHATKILNDKFYANVKGRSDFDHLTGTIDGTYTEYEPRTNRSGRDDDEETTSIVTHLNQDTIDSFTSMNYRDDQWSEISIDYDTPAPDQDYSMKSILAPGNSGKRIYVPFEDGVSFLFDSLVSIRVWIKSDRDTIRSYKNYFSLFDNNQVGGASMGAYGLRKPKYVFDPGTNADHRHKWYPDFYEYVFYPEDFEIKEHSGVEPTGIISGVELTYGPGDVPTYYTSKVVATYIGEGEEQEIVLGCTDNGEQEWSPFPGTQALNYNPDATFQNPDYQDCEYASELYQPNIETTAYLQDGDVFVDYFSQDQAIPLFGFIDPISPSIEEFDFDSTILHSGPDTNPNYRPQLWIDFKGSTDYQGNPILYTALEVIEGYGIGHTTLEFVDGTSNDIGLAIRDATNFVFLVDTYVGDAYDDPTIRLGLYLDLHPVIMQLPSGIDITQPISPRFKITYTTTAGDSSEFYFTLNIGGYSHPGCNDQTANNYNPEATENDGTCTYDIYGCTDPDANNYVEEATIDDGSCEYDPPPVYGYCTLLDGSITENITEDECLLTQGAEWTEGEYEEPEEEEEPIVPSDDQDDIPIVTQTDALITNPADIIHHIIKEEIQTSGSVNTVLAKEARDYHKFRFFNDGFDVNNQWHNWKFGFTISEKINSKDLLEDLAKSTKLFPRFMSNGQFGFNVIKDIYSVQQTGPNNDIKASINKGDILKYSIKKTSKDKVYTRIKIKYRKDYTKNDYNKSTDWITIEDKMAEVSDFSQANYYQMYGMDQQTSTIDNNDNVVWSGGRELEFESDYIRDEDTAKALGHFLLGWNCNAHNIVNITLPISYMHLEVGDTICFDELIDSKIDTEDYSRNYVIKGLGTPQGLATEQYYVRRNGQVIYPIFFITKTVKKAKNVQIEGIQMHDWTLSLENIVGQAQRRNRAGRGDFDFNISNTNHTYSGTGTLSNNIGKLEKTVFTFDQMVGDDIYTFDFKGKDIDFSIVEEGDGFLKVVFNSVNGPYPYNVNVVMNNENTGEKVSKRIKLYHNGDVNSDKKIDRFDVKMLKEMINNKISYKKDQMFLADINEDGVVNSKDLVELLEMQDVSKLK